MNLKERGEKCGVNFNNTLQVILASSISDLAQIFEETSIGLNCEENLTVLYDLNVATAS
jgi:hypothetical protein